MDRRCITDSLRGGPKGQDKDKPSGGQRCEEVIHSGGREKWQGVDVHRLLGRGLGGAGLDNQTRASGMEVVLWKWAQGKWFFRSLC